MICGLWIEFQYLARCSADTNFRKAVWQRWCISNVIKFKRWDIISANWAHLHELSSWRKRFVLLLCILVQLEELIITWHILQGANTKFILELLLYCPLLLVIEIMLQGRDAYYCYAYLFISPLCMPLMLKHVSPNPYLHCDCYLPDPALGKGPLVRSFSEETEVCD